MPSRQRWLVEVDQRFLLRNASGETVLPLTLLSETLDCLTSLRFTMRHWYRVLFLVVGMAPLFVAPWAMAQERPWQPAPGPYGGTTVSDLLLDANGDILAATQGGVFRLAPNSQVWEDDNDGLIVQDVRALLILPDGTLLAGIFGDGVFRKRVGISFWEPSDLRQEVITSFARADDGTLFAGAFEKVFRSTDEGETWEELPPLGSENQFITVSDVVVNVDVLFVATDRGMFRSSDMGDTWEPLAAPWGAFPNLTTVAVSPSGQVYAGSSPQGNLATIYRSPNNGNTWTAVTTRTNPLQIGTITFDLAGNLYVGGFQRVFISRNNGSTFSEARASETTVRAFAFRGGELFAGTVGRGVVSSRDGGLSWSEKNEGMLSSIQVVATSEEGTLYVGTSGGIYRSSDWGTTWTLTNEGLSALSIRSFAFDPEGVPIAGTFGGVYRWDAADERWENIGPPANPGIRDLSYDANGTLYASYFGGLYRFQNNTWTTLPVNPDGNPRQVNTAAVGPNGELYAGTNFDAFRSDDGGQTWTLLEFDNQGTFQRFSAQDIVFDAEGRLYIATRFLSILLSEDQGQTWLRLVNGLTGLEDMRSIVFDNNGVLHVGTFGLGVQRFDQETFTWFPINEGLEDLRVQSIAFDRFGNAFAGTFGKGLYRNLPFGGIATESDAIPETFALQGNYPNPFNPVTTITFSLPMTADVSVEVFDILGRSVLTLPARLLEAGAIRSLQLDASALASGTYLYRVTARTATTIWHDSGTMLLVQ